MKVVTKNYYQTIKEISYSPVECVKKVFPIHKFGEKEKFLGIPLYTYKDDVYSGNDIVEYTENFPYKRNFIFDDIIPRKGYSFEKFDNNIDYYCDAIDVYSKVDKFDFVLCITVLFKRFAQNWWV